MKRNLEAELEVLLAQRGRSFRGETMGLRQEMRIDERPTIEEQAVEVLEAIPASALVASPPPATSPVTPSRLQQQGDQRERRLRPEDVNRCVEILKTRRLENQSEINEDDTRVVGAATDRLEILLGRLDRCY